MADPPRYLVRAREVQDVAMVDTVRVERSSGLAYDRELDADVEVWESVYEGRARFPRADGSDRVIVTGETVTPASPTVKVPWDVSGVLPDDRVTCTGSVSPGMVGRIVWVTDQSPRTFQSAVNLTCREHR